MRHQVDGRQFGRNSSHRKAMFKAMANNLIRSEQIETTVPKAKELRRVVERLITLGKKGSLHARRLAFGRTRDRDSVFKLFDVLAKRYASRNGGYTRILHVDSTRRGDGAEMALIELVDRPIVEKKKKNKTDKAAKHDHAHHDHDHDHDGEKKAKKEARAAKDIEKKAKKAASKDDSGSMKASSASASKSQSKSKSTVRKTSSRSSG